MYKIHTSNPKPGYTTGETRMGGAQRQGGAGRGAAEHAGQVWTAATRCAHEAAGHLAPQGSEDNCPG